MGVARHHFAIGIRFIGQALAGGVCNLMIYGALLFLPAGHWDWWRAWVFLGVVAVGTVATMFGVFLDNMELLRERLKPPIQRGQPRADKILVLLILATYTGGIAFIPLDVFRLHLLPQPGLTLASLGLMMVVAGWWIISLAFKENAFAAPVVKLQAERHQRVIDTGVYRVVRHPMYAGAALLMVGLPMWLESTAGTLFTALPIAALAMRIHFEEAFLKRELPGYAEYVKRVRYRLIPGVW